MAPTPCSSSGTKRSLPFHPSTSLGQKQISSPLKCVSIFYRSAPRPQQLQLLSQAWLGMEMCSWHGTPEPAFGYQPWVWFEVLPQENVHPLAEPSSLRPWRKSPATNSTTSLSSSFNAHLPEGQAAAPWHLSKPAWPQLHRSQCQNYTHCSPPSKEEQEKSSVRKQILNRVQLAPWLCPFSLQPGGDEEEVRMKRQPLHMLR